MHDLIIASVLQLFRDILIPVCICLILKCCTFKMFYCDGLESTGVDGILTSVGVSVI